MYKVTQVIIGASANYFFQSEDYEAAKEQAVAGSEASLDGKTYRHHVIDDEDNIVFECGDEIADLG